MRALFITGATGFIGRHLIRALVPSDVRRAVCLTRKDVPLPGTAVTAEVVKGDLRDPDSYAGALAGCDTVVHLAAATGRASAADFQSVNVDGTQALVQACEKSGVRDFLFVSTIAVTYGDIRHYPYAQSKAAAEDIVRRSSLRHTIVRPTIVLAPEAPIWQALNRMARPRTIVMPGSGRARVQPIHVDDMVAALLAMIRSHRFERQTIGLGGADVLSFEDFLRKIHRVQTGGDAFIVHLPLGPIVTALSWIERITGPSLPVTAGQLSAFGHDSAAGRHPDGVSAPMRGIDQLIRDCVNG